MKNGSTDIVLIGALVIGAVILVSVTTQDVSDAGSNLLSSGSQATTQVINSAGQQATNLAPWVLGGLGIWGLIALAA